jgi:hypothetical protein
MATTGSLFPAGELATRWTDASIVALDYFQHLMRVQGDPF